MALLMVLDSFPIKYTFFLDFLVEQNFDPKFLRFDINTLKLTIGLRNNQILTEIFRLGRNFMFDGALNVPGAF